MQAWNQYQEEHKDRFLNELFDLLKIPSVSADSKYKEDVKNCATAVQQHLLAAGCDVAEICPTPGHPIVYGEKIVDPALPTVLVYGHYDVQPADPLNLWTSGPFEPVIKDGKIYARGACDDKGQMFMHIKALEVMAKTNTLPCNVKVMIEGEEEVGSSNLGKFLEDNKEKLKADIVLVSDTSMISMEHPSIESGLRGLAYMEVEVTGPNRDLHSGVYGGAVGYLSFSGDMDVAIAIRTGVIREGVLHSQAGAGVVADSDPTAEWKETEVKARAVLMAADLVQGGLDAPHD